MENIDTSILISIAVVLVVLLSALGIYVGVRRRKSLLTETKTIEPLVAAQPPLAPLSERLAKTRDFFRSRMEKLLLSKDQKDLQARQWEEIEEILLEADVGISTATALLGKVKERQNGETDIRTLLRDECRNLLDNLPHGPVNSETQKPFVISIVGVNGVGKTTTIGKLANHFRSEGKSVLLGAVDTFRAGAISQLKVWAERSGSQFVSGKEGGDPGAVAFDSVSAGKARGLDIVLLDTAGRLHTKTNLMEELKKIHRVVKKVIPEAPHETWLVLDGTIGQNSIQQAKEFQKAMDLTGVIITKLDGTAKGGAIFTIASELRLPIKYIGVGESIKDFVPFDSKVFVDAILG